MLQQDQEKPQSSPLNPQPILQKPDENERLRKLKERRKSRSKSLGRDDN